ncbi:MAG: alpha-amylase [Ignavibacteriales bacterium]|nr:alpha-amylase [Ignavibacteriales bacterium]
MFINSKSITLSIIMSLLLFTRLFAQPAESNIKAPEWSKNLSIYEVNLRQYTQSGTINEFMTKLPKLKEMGVGILWFMPVHPIGEKNRKGTMGSYYAVKDYYGLAPEYGTKEDFKKMVQTIHQMGMYVIIDWVANHTSWDNQLAVEHPEFYTKDSAGNFIPPVADWADVIKLNFENKELWNYMSGAMEYWVKDMGIDGFRCDVAGMVPTPFWQFLRPRLEKIKPVFMLAEWETVEIHNNAFDMTYGWDFMHTMIAVAKGEKKPFDILKQIQKESTIYPVDAYRMRFTTNHDENSWNGTSQERFGKAAGCYNVLSATVPGMFLVYSGQEAGETKRLNFFEKDPIEWKEHPDFTLFQKLIQLKKETPALWNGKHGGEFDVLYGDSTSSVVTFIRYTKEKSVIVCVNLSDKDQQAIIGDRRIKGNLKEWFTGARKSNKGMIEFRLKPFEYQVWIKG